ncbi:MAG TPA: hypothetical protein VI876_10085 [Dehalococcoidia bacterium]|nr:hypothetical protein [Dehalococcoidia bacterium]
MELASKVTALEEEVAVLKGEIKTILQEVRTAVLARENPFAADSYENLHIPSPAAAPHPAAEPEAPPRVIQLNPAPEPDLQHPQTTPSQPWAAVETDVARQPLPSTPPAKRRWSAGALATLMAWTQDTTSRMDASDLDIVLSMARYGGLIEEELEATLTKLAAPLFPRGQEKRRSGVSDYLLALRELAALIEDAEEGYRSPSWKDSVRRAS